MRNEPGDVCEIIQNRFNELGIPVAVSLRTLDVCDCNHADCTKNNQIDYLVFQSSLLGYQFFVYNPYMTPIDYSYENFDGTWADYTESPFVYAVIDFDTVLDIIRSVSPRRRSETEYKPYGQVPCDLYRWLITLAPMAVNDAEVFMRNYNGLKRFAELAGPDGIILDENYQTFVSVAHIYPDIYAYYYGLDGSLCTKYNIHDLMKIISAVSAYVNNSNVAGPYELIEDFDKRIYPQKYPNGAFRGVVLIPDWPGDGYEALKIAHVADSIIVNERVAVPKGMRVEGYVCNGCKDVFIRHEAEVKVNCLLQSELEVYNECACCWPVRKIVSNDGIYNSLDDDVWTYTLHHALETTGGWSTKPDYAGDVPPVTNSGNSIWSDAAPVNPTPKPEPIEKKSYEDYVEESRTPSKYDWLANIPGMGPMTNMEPVKRTVGLYRYMQHLAENNGWLNCGEGYMIIGPEDDYQSRKHNLQNSLLVYNPNDVPIRVSFMVFS